MQHEMTTLSAGIMLFLIFDPLGNIPFFLSVLRTVAPERRLWIMVRELLIALALLLLFLVGGRGLLAVMQLRQEAISMAGGIVLFLIALRMVFPPADGGGIFGPPGAGEPFIVPLAIPCIAGPSALAAVLLLTSTAPTRRVEWAAALIVAWLATAVILLGSTFLFKWLGERVLTALERVMGMLLIALAVQMLLGGLEAYLHAAA